MKSPPDKDASLRVALVVLSCLVSVLTGVVLSRGSADGGKSEHRKLLIGLSMDTLKEERWQRDRDIFAERAKELGADVLVQAANGDDARQIQDVESLISRKVDALVIIPHNGAAMAKAVEKAREAGIPTISYDRLITGADVDLYLSFDAVKIGAAQAQYLIDSWRGKGKLRIVRIHGAKTDNNSFLLKQGQDEALKSLLQDGRAVILHEDWAENWKPENAKKIVNAAITRLGNHFDAVLAANDGTAGGAIQALTEEGLAGKILVTGQDAELAACQRIVSGTQSMTVYTPLKKLARRGAELAVRMAQGKVIVAPGEIDNGKVKVPNIALDVLAATKDNMIETIVRDGFHGYDDVYRGVPENLRPKRPE